MGMGIIHRGVQVALGELYEALLACSPIFAYRLNGMNLETETVPNDGFLGSNDLVLANNDAPATFAGPDGLSYPELGRDVPSDADNCFAFADADFDAYADGFTVIVVYYPLTTGDADDGFIFMRRESPSVEASESMSLLSLSRYCSTTTTSSGSVANQTFKNFSAGVMQAGAWKILEQYFPAGDNQPVMYEDGIRLTGTSITEINTGVRFDRGTLQPIFLGSNDEAADVDSACANGYYAIAVGWNSEISQECRDEYLDAAYAEGWLEEHFLRLVGYVDPVIGNDVDGLDVDANGDYVYAVSENGDSFFVIDVTNPAVPVRVGIKIDGTVLNSLFDCKYVSSGLVIAVGRGGGRFVTMDVSTPTIPDVLDSITDATTLTGMRAVVFKGTTAFCCTEANRLTSVDFSDPSDLSIISSFLNANFNAPWDLAIDEVADVIYVASNTGDRVVSVDVSNPASMSEIQAYTDATNLNGVWGLALSADRQTLYCACDAGTGRLTVLDVSDPADIQHVGTVTGIAGAHGIYVKDVNTIYVTEYFGDQIHKVDVSTPSSPTLDDAIQHEVLLDQTWDIAGLSGLSAGDYVYAATDGLPCVVALRIT